MLVTSAAIETPSLVAKLLRLVAINGLRDSQGQPESWWSETLDLFDLRKIGFDRPELSR
jgi:hypothetical protein